MHWSVVVWIIAIFLFHSLSSKNITRLQNVQNCLAHFVSGASRFPHITPTLKSLHWLPVKQCIIFKTLVLIHKYLTTGKPKCFAPYLSLYTSAVKTRHSNPDKMFLKVPLYSLSVHKSKVHFNKCFSYDTPKIWNDLPLEIQTAPTLSCFKRRLKTYQFQKSFPLSRFYYYRPLIVVTALSCLTSYDSGNIIWMVCLRICKIGD